MYCARDSFARYMIRYTFPQLTNLNGQELGRYCNQQNKTMEAFIKEFKSPDQTMDVLEINYASRSENLAGEVVNHNEYEMKRQVVQRNTSDWVLLNKSAKLEIIPPRTNTMVTKTRAREIIASWKKYLERQKSTPAGNVNDDITKILNLVVCEETWAEFQNVALPEQTMEYLITLLAHAHMKRLERNHEEWRDESELFRTMVELGSDIRSRGGQEARTRLSEMADFLGIRKASTESYFEDWATMVRIIFQLIKDWVKIFKFNKTTPVDLLQTKEPWAIKMLPEVRTLEEIEPVQGALIFARCPEYHFVILSSVKPLELNVINEDCEYTNIKGQRRLIETMANSKYVAARMKGYLNKIIEGLLHNDDTTVLKYWKFVIKKIKGMERSDTARLYILASELNEGSEQNVVENIKRMIDMEEIADPKTWMKMWTKHYGCKKTMVEQAVPESVPKIEVPDEIRRDIFGPVFALESQKMTKHKHERGQCLIRDCEEVAGNFALCYGCVNILEFVLRKNLYSRMSYTMEKGKEKVYARERYEAMIPDLHPRARTFLFYQVSKILNGNYHGATAYIGAIAAAQMDSGVEKTWEHEEYQNNDNLEQAMKVLNENYSALSRAKTWLTVKKASEGLAMVFQLTGAERTKRDYVGPMFVYFQDGVMKMHTKLEGLNMNVWKAFKETMGIEIEEFISEFQFKSTISEKEAEPWDELEYLTEMQRRSPKIKFAVVTDRSSYFRKMRNMQAREMNEERRRAVGGKARVTILGLADYASLDVFYKCDGTQDKPTMSLRPMLKTMDEGLLFPPVTKSDWADWKFLANLTLGKSEAKNLDPENLWGASTWNQDVGARYTTKDVFERLFCINAFFIDLSARRRLYTAYLHEADLWFDDKKAYENLAEDMRKRTSELNHGWNERGSAKIPLTNKNPLQIVSGAMRFVMEYHGRYYVIMTDFQLAMELNLRPDRRYTERICEELVSEWHKYMRRFSKKGGVSRQQAMDIATTHLILRPRNADRNDRPQKWEFLPFQTLAKYQKSTRGGERTDYKAQGRLTTEQKKENAKKMNESLTVQAQDTVQEQTMEMSDIDSAFGSRVGSILVRRRGEEEKFPARPGDDDFRNREEERHYMKWVAEIDSEDDYSSAGSIREDEDEEPRLEGEESSEDEPEMPHSSARANLGKRNEVAKNHGTKTVDQDTDSENDDREAEKLEKELQKTMERTRLRMSEMKVEPELEEPSSSKSSMEDEIMEDWCDTPPGLELTMVQRFDLPAKDDNNNEEAKSQKPGERFPTPTMSEREPSERSVVLTRTESQNTLTDIAEVDEEIEQQDEIMVVQKKGKKWKEEEGENEPEEKLEEFPEEVQERIPIFPNRENHGDNAENRNAEKKRSRDWENMKAMGINKSHQLIKRSNVIKKWSKEVAEEIKRGAHAICNAEKHGMNAEESSEVRSESWEMV